MTDYSKKTVAELTEILKSRGLPSSGKKAELVARLNENDKSAQDSVEDNVADDPISAAATVPVPSVAPTAALVEPVVAEPTVVDAPPESTTEPVESESTVESKTFTLNLATSDVSSEIAKRKARAERFGTGGQHKADAESTETASADADALKSLERAKRFGGGETAIGKLDEALPSEREHGSRGRKRGHGAVEEGSTMQDPGLKRSFASRGRDRIQDRGRGAPPRGGKPSGVTKNAAAFTSEKDRLAAEARKKKFATA